MVDFTLTDEQKDLRELAHNFAEKEIRSVAWEYDRDATWPQEVIEKAARSRPDDGSRSRGVRGLARHVSTGRLIEEEFGWDLLRHPHVADVQRFWRPPR